MNEQIDFRVSGVPDPLLSTTKYYSKDGVPIDVEPKQVLAKVVSTPTTVSSQKSCSRANRTQVVTYHVLFQNGRIFDPFNQDSHRSKAARYDLTKVNQEVFQHYIMFLKNKSKTHLFRAERALNG